MEWGKFFENSSPINEAFIVGFDYRKAGIGLFPVGLLIGDTPFWVGIVLKDGFPPDSVILGFKPNIGFSFSVFLKPKLLCCEEYWFFW